MTEENDRSAEMEYTLVNKVYGYENGEIGALMDMIGYDDDQAHYEILQALKQGYNRPHEAIKDYSDLEAVNGVFLEDDLYCLVINLDANLVSLYELI